ncbi:hypothetical protein X737_19155 [Mesorhizobium sp. L48C026A00]|nr:hypothetical protein X737_19155 [Mesorhizobium sp. L48C026A00]
MSTLLADLLLSAAPSVSGWHFVIVGASMFRRKSGGRIEMLSSLAR